MQTICLEFKLKNRFPILLLHLFDFTEFGLYITKIYKSLIVEFLRRKHRKGWLTGVSKAIHEKKNLFLAWDVGKISNTNFILLWNRFLKWQGRCLLAWDGKFCILGAYFHWQGNASFNRSFPFLWYYNLGLFQCVK